MRKALEDIKNLDWDYCKVMRDGTFCGAVKTYMSSAGVSVALMFSPLFVGKVSDDNGDFSAEDCKTYLINNKDIDAVDNSVYYLHGMELTLLALAEDSEIIDDTSMIVNYYDDAFTDIGLDDAATKADIKDRFEKLRRIGNSLIIES